MFDQIAQQIILICGIIIFDNFFCSNNKKKICSLGLELTGNEGLAKIFAQEPSIKPAVPDENITSSSIS